MPRMQASIHTGRSSRTRQAVSAAIALLAAASAAAAQETGGATPAAAPAVPATSAQAPVSPSPAPASEPPRPASTAAEPIERQPYRIVFHFACHPSSRIDAARRAELVRDWQVMVRRFVGTPWIVSVAPPSNPVLELDLQGLEKSTPAQAAAFEKAVNASSFDKVWVVHADRTESGPGVVFSGREYDTATRRLGPLQRRTVQVLADAPRALLQFTLDLFSPTALISGEEGGRALLTVRGSSIEPASPIGRVVEPGTVFQPLRLISAKDGRIIVKIIPWTYLRVESVDGPVARCAIVSGLNDPLTRRMLQPNTLAAVGIKPGNSPLPLRFITSKDKTPGAGYTLTARTVPNGAIREVGMTDRAGRIVLKPGFADGLVILRLLAGNIEPVREFPIMPGESSEERTISFEPKYQSVALEVEVDTLRDEVVDLIALRARLEARMKARLEGEDWVGLEDAIKEFNRLTPRDEYVKKLAEIKERATKQQIENKVAILTKNAQAQINDLQAMIDRYLDDEAIKAYREAHDKGLAEMGEKEKAKLKAAADAAKAAKAAEAAIREAEKAAKAAPKTKAAPAARPKPAEANKPVSNPPEPGPVVPF
jgi:hypothetical protein